MTVATFGFRHWALWPAILVAISLIGGWVASTVLYRHAQRQGEVVLANSAIALSAFGLAGSLPLALGDSVVAKRQVEASQAVMLRELARLEQLGWDTAETRWMRHLISAVIETRTTLTPPMPPQRREFLLGNLRVNLGKLTASAEVAHQHATRTRSEVLRTLYAIHCAIFATALVAVVVAVIGYVRQQHQRSRYERSLRDANDQLLARAEEMEEIVYAASHDLKEPLRMVHAYVDLLSLRLQTVLTGDASRHFEFVRTGATRMQSLVDDLMKLSMLGHDDDDTPDEEFDPRTVVDELRPVFQDRLAAIGGEIAVGTLPRLNVSRSRFAQLMQNLVGNAIKYRDHSRPLRIRITAHPENSVWHFAVEDNGIGVPEQHREHIFKLFRRLHGQEIEGTGAGLAICRKIVSGWRGRIWVEPAAPAGSRFTFTVPR
ncbi:MAG: hypothetical protein H0W72_04450 [Planctomycetes bacterium]|nr:hypothetical protein [Planctomycetota bacterium]